MSNTYGAVFDLVIWITRDSFTIRNSDLHHAVDYTPCGGMEISCWPDYILSRGKVVWHQGDVIGLPGDGQFLPCGRPDAARPKPRNY